MPQFQILEPAPSFGQQLGLGLGSGISQGIAGSLDQYFKQKQMKGVLESLGLSGTEKEPTTGSLVPKTEKTGLDTLNAKKPGINVTPEKIVAAHFLDPSGKLASSLSSIYQGQQSAAEKRSVYEMEKADKYLTGVNEEAKKLPERKVSLQTAINAVESGVHPIGDWLADALNLPGLRGAPAAQLNTAAKTNLMGSLNSLPGARPNQFIEQQIANSFAKAGQSKEANLSQLEILKAIYDMDANRVELANQAADQYTNAGAPIPGNIERMVLQETKPYNEQRMKELAYDLQVLNERDMGPEKLGQLKSVAAGTPLTAEKARIILEKSGVKDPQNPTPEEEAKAMKVAVRLGYEIPSFEIYSRKK